MTRTLWTKCKNQMTNFVQRYCLKEDRTKKVFDFLNFQVNYVHVHVPWKSSILFSMLSILLSTCPERLSVFCWKLSRFAILWFASPANTHTHCIKIQQLTNEKSTCNKMWIKIVSESSTRMYTKTMLKWFWRPDLEIPCKQYLENPPSHFQCCLYSRLFSSKENVINIC